MTHEIETIETGFELIPYGEFVSGAIKFVDFASSWGREEPWKLAVDWLQKEIDHANAELVYVNQRLNEINQNFQHDENLARLTLIETYIGNNAGMLGDLIFRLSLTK